MSLSTNFFCYNPTTGTYQDLSAILQVGANPTWSTPSRLYFGSSSFDLSSKFYFSLKPSSNPNGTNYYFSSRGTNVDLAKQSQYINTVYNINNSNLVRYYPFDTDLSDCATGSAVSNTSITPTRDQTSDQPPTIVTTNTKLSSGSLYFDGTSYRGVKIPEITVASGGFTFACWIKFITGDQGSRIIDFGNTNGGSSATNNIIIYKSNEGSNLQLGLAIYSPSSGTGTAGYNTNYTITDTNWHHMCITISSGGVWSLYIDGASSAISITAYPSLSSIETCYIGADNFGFVRRNQMYLNQVLIFNRALTSAEIRIIYNYPTNLTFTSSVTTSDILGLEFLLSSFTSANIGDQDNTGKYNLTKNNSGGATFNDSTRGYVASMTSTTSSIHTNYPTTQSFTRTFWYYPDTLAAQNTLSSTNMQIYFSDTTGKISAKFNSTTTLIDTTTRSAKTWTHYTVTYNYSTSTAILFVNGNQVASNTSIIFNGDTNGLQINSYNSSGGGGISYFDKIRCYSCALSATDVLNIYNTEYIAQASISYTGATAIISGAYTILPFITSTSDGASTGTITISNASNKTFYYLCVAGGGAGGSAIGGGGGGGGFLEGSFTINGSNTISISVGNGGSAAASNTAWSAVSAIGKNSSITFSPALQQVGTIISIGGGYGGWNNGYGASRDPSNGGSGGGGGNNTGNNSLNKYGTGTQGNNGGKGIDVGGGGGGAGGAGDAGKTSDTSYSNVLYRAAKGGIGKVWTYADNIGYYRGVYWAGGGGGSGIGSAPQANGGNGGNGGGGGGGGNNTAPGTGGNGLNNGNGGTDIVKGGSGGANTGGGGGGGASESGGGSGGSGIVIIAY